MPRSRPCPRSSRGQGISPFPELPAPALVRHRHLTRNRAVQRIKRACLALGCAILLAACAGPVPLPDSARAGDRYSTAVELETTPFYPQTVHQCGPAALATVLNTAGVQISPEDLGPRVYLPARQGSLQTELLGVTRHYGYLPYVIQPEFTALLDELHAGRPVLILQNLGIGIAPLWHYAVVIGYLPESAEVVLRSGTTQRESMPASTFLRTWQRAGYWGFVVLRPDELPARPDRDAYLGAAADLESVGQIEPAGQAYAAAVARWPESATAWLGLGNTRYNLGEKQAAEDSFRQAIRAEAGYVAAYNNLAEVLADRGCSAAALEILEHALRLPQATGTIRKHLLASRQEILARHRQQRGTDERESCPPDGELLH